MFKLLFISVFVFIAPLYANNAVELTRNTFSALVEDKDDIWIVKFCTRDDRQCKEIADDFIKSSKILARYVRLGCVDIEKEKVLAYTYQIQYVPKILLFGHHKSRPKTMDGFKTIRGFTNAAVKLIEEDVNELVRKKYVESGVVEELDDYSLKDILTKKRTREPWCVVYYSSECHECMKFANSFEDLAIYFRNSIHFAAIDVLKHSHVEDNYPQVKYYKTQAEVSEFSGEFAREPMKKWLLEQLAEPLVSQLVNSNSLQVTCQWKKYCGILVLPTLEECDEGCRLKFVEGLKEASLAYKRLSIGWVWFEHGEQPKLELLLKVQEAPRMVMVDVKKLSMIHADKFTTFGVEEFMKNVTTGTGFDQLIEADNFPEMNNVKIWIPNKKEHDNIDIKDEL